MLPVSYPPISILSSVPLEILEEFILPFLSDAELFQLPLEYKLKKDYSSFLWKKKCQFLKNAWESLKQTFTHENKRLHDFHISKALECIPTENETLAVKVNKYREAIAELHKNKISAFITQQSALFQFNQDPLLIQKLMSNLHSCQSEISFNSALQDNYTNESLLSTLRLLEMNKLPGVTTLEFRHVEMTDEIVEKLSLMITKNHSLSTLKIVAAIWTDKKIGVLSNAISLNKTLTSLELDNVQFASDEKRNLILVPIISPHTFSEIAHQTLHNTILNRPEGFQIKITVNHVDLNPPEKQPPTDEEPYMRYFG